MTISQNDGLIADPDRVSVYLSQTRLLAPEAQLMAGRARRGTEYDFIRQDRQDFFDNEQKIA